MADDEKDYSYYRLKLFDAYVVQLIEKGRREQYLKKINEALKKIEEIQEQKKILDAKIKAILDGNKCIKDEKLAEEKDPVDDKEKSSEPPQKMHNNILKRDYNGSKQSIDEKDPVASEKPQKLDVHFSRRRLFITGFAKGTNEEEIRECFSQFGKVEDISLFPAKNYAFVTFEYYYKFPPYVNYYKGKTFDANLLKPKNDVNLKTKTILVSGVLTNIHEDSMANYFSKYGKVTRVNKQRYGDVKRFAYVIFEKHESAAKAVETACHLIEGKLVDIRKARED